MRMSYEDGGNPLRGAGPGSTGSICTVGGVFSGPLDSKAFPGTFSVPNGLAAGTIEGLWAGNECLCAGEKGETPVTTFAPKG